MIVCDGCGKAGGAEVQFAKVEGGRNEPIGSALHLCRNCKEEVTNEICAAFLAVLIKRKK